MTFKILDRQEAENLYEKYSILLKDGNVTGFRDEVMRTAKDAGHQSRHTSPTEMQIMDVVAQLQNLQKKYPKPSSPVDANLWEAEAACSLHAVFANVHSSIVTNFDYWRWLALAYFSSTIDWRYGCGKESAATKANYGIGNSGENLLYRLWLRGDIGHSDLDSDDPYRLTRSGQLDFWRSHIQRQGYADSRQFAHALLRFQYPKGNTEARLKTEDIRTLVVRLRRLRTNLLVEVLNFQECFDLIRSQAEMIMGRSLAD